MRRYKRWIGVIAIAAVVAVLLVIVVCDGWVRGYARDKTFDTTDAIPHRTVGLLLGTAPITPQGEHNYYFDYRIEAAARLFQAGKIDYILVSGDNHDRDYDEPSCMRDSLVAHGVPADRIVLDYAGFRTLDSIVRAKEIFGRDSLTIISQKFHNERAIYLAKSSGISAVGYNARDVSRWDKYIKIHGREYLARVKMFLDLLTDKQPRFLGEKEETPF
ncbi:ElyC/SanA/YdcF family protein [Barnesiella sp. An22]|uniref:SanA/YdcF family protein n=1 Tax=Barnesiella sp. An22 TaxID=1965590 RepID=UPI0032091C85